MITGKVLDEKTKQALFGNRWSIIMAKHAFTGFGFGPIQAGLFVKEAYQSGNFARIVVAEIDQGLIDAVRANKGSYYVNVARADGIEVSKIDNLELLNPDVPDDRKLILGALAASTEISTCLPSVSFYDSGTPAGAVSLIADGLKDSKAKATIVYTAENNNRAAEILQKDITAKIGAPPPNRVQFLNTVIGKMSRVVTDSSEIAQLKLKPIAPGFKRAFLVEEFNRILVTRTTIPGFKPGLEVFIEKDHLLPFEEAKLYGHNAVHTLLGFIGAVKGATSITELKNDSSIMQIGRNAFLNECGAALIKKYDSLEDDLFTEAGFKNYAEDLLERITNPYLNDTIARASRDAVRKLALNDRIFGTMALALEHGIEPTSMALGAMAGIAALLRQAEENGLPDNLRFGDWRELKNDEIEKIILWIWNNQTGKHVERLIGYVHSAKKHLMTFIDG